MKITISKSLYLKARKIHFYAGLVMIPFLFVFGVSGFLFNHSTYFHGRKSETFALERTEQISNLLPDLDSLAYGLKNVLTDKGVLVDGMRISDLKFDENLVVRSSTSKADYRLEFNLSNDYVRLLTLPDFAENATIDFGKQNIGVDGLNQNIEKLSDNILKNKNLESGKTRIQRMPYLTFKASNRSHSYLIGLNVLNGDYYVDDLDKKDFKLDYFLLNLHQEHGYPIGEVNTKTIWVLFADCLSILLMVWAITGIIMWLKIKKQLIIGLVLTAISIGITVFILFKYSYLGY
jgi:hypothetical protein